jgi:hypothetical protein
MRVRGSCVLPGKQVRFVIATRCYPHPLNATRHCTKHSYPNDYDCQICFYAYSHTHSHSHSLAHSTYAHTHIHPYPHSHSPILTLAPTLMQRPQVEDDADSSDSDSESDYARRKVSIQRARASDDVETRVVPQVRYSALSDHPNSHHLGSG